MKLNVAAVQLSSGSDIAHNIEVAERLSTRPLIREPSTSNCPSSSTSSVASPGFEGAAETIPGPTTTRMAALAKSRGVTLHLGSLLEVSPVAGKFHNTSVVIGPDGEIVATYRKIHLFDVNVPGAIVHRESDDHRAGRRHRGGATRAEYSLGLSICFDVRFPELYRALALAGADVLAIPAAFNATTGLAHWDLLVRARAVENHAFVVAATQVGTTDEGIATYGHALIVDPWGDALAESTSDGPEVIIATLDLDEVDRRRHPDRGDGLSSTRCL